MYVVQNCLCVKKVRHCLPDHLGERRLLERLKYVALPFILKIDQSLVGSVISTKRRLLSISAGFVVFLNLQCSKDHKIIFPFVELHPRNSKAELC